MDAIDVQQQASFLVEQHGENAEEVAARSFDECKEADDGVGMASWTCIMLRLWEMKTKELHVKARYIFPDCASISFSSIDAEHKGLVDLLNLVRDIAEQSDTTTAQLSALLAAFRNRVAEHFAHEEMAMVQTKYPDLPAHKGQHEMFLNRIDLVIASFKESGVTIVDALETLYSDCVQDALTDDMQFKAYLDDQRITWVQPANKFECL